MGNFTQISKGVFSQYTVALASYDATTKRFSSSTSGVLDSQSYNALVSTRSGGKTPNYRAIVKAGGILPDQPLTRELYEQPNNNWAVLESSSANAAGSWNREVRSVIKMVPFAFNSRPPNPFTDLQLNNRLISKAKGAEWSLPVFFGELKETAGMVTKTATHIAEMAYALRKGNVVAFFKLFHPSAKAPRERALRRATSKFQKNFGSDPVKAINSAWLEYQYGWKPFLKDVDDAFKLLSEVQDRGAEPSVSSVRTRLTQEQIITTSSNSLFSMGGLTFAGIGYENWTLSGSAIWRFKIKEFGLIGKLGLTNPLSVAYELATLSFVVDWFVPIGNYLAALDVPMRFTHVGGAYGFKAEGHSKMINVTAPVPWRLVSSNIAPCKWLYIQRRPMTGIPSIKLGDLTFRANLGIQQATSAIALLSQTVKGIPRRRY